MTPAQAQQHALNELEDLGGKPVVLQEDASLPNLARIQIATAARSVHVLSYNPKAAPELAYLVCFQCELTKRALMAAPDERFNVASNDDTYRQVEKLVQQMKAVPAAMVQSYSRIITDGLGTQLRSMPIGIRADRDLFHAHPELRDQQRACAERSMKENVGCLHPNIRSQAPELILQASATMNAAFALAWGRLWNEDAIVFRADLELSTNYTAISPLDFQLTNNKRPYFVQTLIVIGKSPGKLGSKANSVFLKKKKN
jgi:hypothetical protein